MTERVAELELQNEQLRAECAFLVQSARDLAAQLLRERRLTEQLARAASAVERHSIALSD